jgi:hypothetical protein
MPPCNLCPFQKRCLSWILTSPMVEDQDVTLGHSCQVSGTVGSRNGNESRGSEVSKNMDRAGYTSLERTGRSGNANRDDCGTIRWVEVHGPYVGTTYTYQFKGHLAQIFPDIDRVCEPSIYSAADLHLLPATAASPPLMIRSLCCRHHVTGTVNHWVGIVFRPPNRTVPQLVPESDSGSMNLDRGTWHRSPFSATMR